MTAIFVKLEIVVDLNQDFNYSKKIYISSEKWHPNSSPRACCLRCVSGLQGEGGTAAAGLAGRESESDCEHGWVAQGVLAGTVVLSASPLPFPLQGTGTGRRK